MTTRAVARPGGAGRLLIGLVTLLSGEAVARLLVVGVGLTVARVLGPTSLGQLSFGLSILALCTVVSDAGFTTYAMREIVSRPQRRRSLVVNATVVQLGLAAVMGGILVAVAYLAPLPTGTGPILMALAPLLLAQAANTLYALQSAERFRAVALVKVAREIVTTALAISLVVTARKLVLVPVAMWTGFLVGDAICARFLVSTGDLGPAPVERRLLRELLFGGWPFLANALLAQVVIGCDVIFLAAMHGAHAAGVYAAAFQLANYALLVAAIVSTTVFPQLTRRWHHDREGFARLVRRLVALSVRTTLPVATAVIVCAPAIIRLIYGPRLAESGLLLSILVGLPILGYYNTITGQALIAAGRVRLHLFVIAVAAASALISLAALVPPFGPVGAAAATVTVEAVSALWLTVLLPRHLHFGSARAAVHELPAVLPICGAVVLLRVLNVPPALILALAVLAGGAREIPWMARALRSSRRAIGSGDLGVP